MLQEIKGIEIEKWEEKKGTWLFSFILHCAGHAR